jgi:hypothetical protein
VFSGFCPIRWSPLTPTPQTSPAQTGSASGTHTDHPRITSARADSTPEPESLTPAPSGSKKKALNRSQLRALESAHSCLWLYHQVKPAAAAFISTPKNVMLLVFIVCLVCDTWNIKKALNRSQLRALGHTFCLRFLSGSVFLGCGFHC